MKLPIWLLCTRLIIADEDTRYPRIQLEVRLGDSAKAEKALGWLGGRRKHARVVVEGRAIVDALRACEYPETIIDAVGAFLEVRRGTRTDPLTLEEVVEKGRRIDTIREAVVAERRRTRAPRGGDSAVLL